MTLQKKVHRLKLTTQPQLMHLVSTDTFIYIYIYIYICKDWFSFFSLKDEWTQAQRTQYNEFVESELKS